MMSVTNIPVLGQVGLGAAGSGLAALAIVVSILVLTASCVVPLACYSAEIARLIRDLATRRNFLEESERNRRLDGRLLTERRAGD